MTSASRFYPLLFAALLLAACGQKGPLYLPGNPSEIRTAVPATGTSTAAEDAASEDDDQDEQDEQR